MTNTNNKWKKHSQETQTLHAGCSKAEPKIFALPQTPFPWAWIGQNLISWRWLHLYLQTQFGEDRCTQFRVILVTDPHPPSHRQDPQYTAPGQLARSVTTHVERQRQTDRQTVPGEIWYHHNRSGLCNVGQLTANCLLTTTQPSTLVCYSDRSSTVAKTKQNYTSGNCRYYRNKTEKLLEKLKGKLELVVLRPAKRQHQNIRKKSGPPQCHLPTQLKDVSVSTIPGALSALEALCDYALSTFTLHLMIWSTNVSHHQEAEQLIWIICISLSWL